MSPSRKLAVGAMICATLLIAIAPAISSYSSARSDYQLAQQTLAETLIQLQQLGELQAAQRSARIELTALVEHSVAADVYRFRSALVGLTRDAGCSIRRIQLEPANTRDWQDDDLSPLEPAQRGAGKNSEAKYELRSQRVSLSVAGGLEHVKLLLATCT